MRILKSMASSLLHTAESPSAIRALLSDGLAGVVDVIREELDSPLPEVQRLVDHVAGYHGKMLRPSLALLSAALVDHTFEPGSERFKEVVTIGAVIEIIHLATLVHDDVLDLSPTRRGGPTVNALDGNELAVILGDYLISKAFELCSRLPKRGDSHTASRVGQIASMVCEGEILQLSNRGNLDLPAHTYAAIIERKTAALIAVAAEQAVIHTIAPTVDRWRAQAGDVFDLAADLGAAFQIQDDVLDLTGTQDEVGKPLGVDFELGKLTLPLIHYRDAGGDVHALIGKSRADVVEAVQSAGALGSAHAEAQRRVNSAIKRLEGFADSPARAYLISVAHTVLNRTA